MPPSATWTLTDPPAILAQDFARAVLNTQHRDVVQALTELLTGLGDARAQQAIGERERQYRELTHERDHWKYTAIAVHRELCALQDELHGFAAALNLRATRHPQALPTPTEGYS